MRSNFKKFLYIAVVLPSVVLSMSGFTPVVGQRIELDANRNARTGANFLRTTNNVSFLAARGLTGEITEVRHFTSGNYGIQINVTGGTDVNGQPRVGQSVWVHYQVARSSGEVDPGSRYLKIKNDLGEVLNADAIPEQGITAEVIADRVPARSSIDETAAPAAVVAPAVEPETGSDEAAAPAPALDTQASPPPENCVECSLVGGGFDQIRGNSRDILRAATAATPLDAQIASYSSSRSVQRLVADALRNQNPSALGQCSRYVRLSLQRTGLVSGSYGPRWAAHAPAALRAQGFTNLMANSALARRYTANPNSIPRGAVVVYNYTGRAGRSGPVRPFGHIEIKTGAAGSGGFIGYRHGPRAFYGSAGRRGREIVGVFIRPGVR